jgi:hypothetical protein
LLYAVSQNATVRTKIDVVDDFRGQLEQHDADNEQWAHTATAIVG